MAEVFQDLIGNAAVVVLFIFTWAEGQRWLEGASRLWHSLVFALWFGSGAVATMLLAVQVSPGVYIDLRVTMIALASYFGGPFAGLLAAGMAASARAALGGAGLTAGLLTIGVAFAGGAAANLISLKHGPSLRSLLALASAAGAAALAVLLVVPPDRWGAAITQSVLPLALINGASCFIAAYAVLRVQRHRSEQHLLRAALSQAPDFFYVKDVHSRFIAVNDAVAGFNGFRSAKEMLGKSDFDLNDHSRARRLFLDEQSLMHGGNTSSDAKEELITAGGVSRCFVTTKRAILDATGSTVGLVGVTRDITEHRLLEEELRANRDLLSHALAEMPDGVAMFDADGGLAFSNERYRTSFPRTYHARIPGALLREILEEVVRTGEQIGAPQSDADGWIESVLGSLRSGGEEQIELFDGRWLQVRTRVASDGGAMVVISDVTAIKKAETDLLGLTAQLRALASTDGLTGLANRRMFDQALQLEMAKVVYGDLRTALLMIDVDHFKAYNDLYGHPAGDDCLRLIGACLSNVGAGPNDLIARYGGEEFAIVLSDVEEKKAIGVAEAIRSNLRQLAIPHSGNPGGVVSVSIGIARSGTGIVGAQGLLSRADAALYAAKSQGRNRIELAGERLTGLYATAASQSRR